MTNRQTPPTRKSWEWVVVVKPFGPHHFAKCFGLVNAAKSNSGGASNMRVPMIERASLSRSILFSSAMSGLPLVLFSFGLQCPEVVIEPVETLLPETAVFFEPVVRFLERARIDAAGPHLGVAAARDQACTLEHFEMLGNGGKAHLERFGELEHRAFPECELRQNCAPCWIGECSESRAEAVSGH